MHTIKDKLVTTEEAFSCIKDYDDIVTAMAVSEPQSFFRGLAPVAKKYKGLNVYCANPAEPYECFTDHSLATHLEINTMFLTNAIRKQHGHDVVHYIPQHLSKWARHLLDRCQVDIFWGSCTKPDKRGFVNLGPSACYEAEILRNAKIVILEVNENLPHTYGGVHIPIDWVNHFISNTHPLLTVPRPEISETDRTIAGHIGELIEDESTLQLGIGGIPNALGEVLKDKKDLGIHTEMINDTIMDLYKHGAITGRKKTLWPDKIVGSFALGTAELYKFMDQNPVIELQPSSSVNDIMRFGRNYKMTSINTAVEVDLTGQVCSESIGHRELSGVGGAFDTHMGAQYSKGGRGIIAMHSTTKDGKNSKICFELHPGAKVSISRNDIDTIVTEYGVAELKGQTVATRVKRLIGISNPKFRDELLAQAKSVNYI